MKLFFGLMAVLLLSFSFFPCGDKVECVKEYSMAVIENSSHDGHDHNTELCTPFCSCACCSIVFYSEVPVKTISPKYIFPSEKFPIFSTVFHNNVFYSIWHPPQLAA